VLTALNQPYSLYGSRRLLCFHTSAHNRKVHDVDYCFAIFGMCNGSYHGQVNGADYSFGMCNGCFTIFGMCNGLCHGELSVVDYCLRTYD